MRRALVIVSVVAGSVAVAGACADDTASACPEVVSVPDVDVWTDDRGCDVPPHEIYSRAGDEACGWELVDEIVISDVGAYHWDPVNLLAYVDQQVRNRTFRTADVIDDLVDTGWRRGTDQLWRHPDDDTHVYLVRDDQADRYLLDRAGTISCSP